MGSRSLRFLGTLLLPVVGVGLVLALFEVGLRIVGHRPIYEIYSKPTLFWQHDPELGWVHQPGARGEYVGPRPWPIEFRAPVEINALGLRGPEVAPEADDALRVLFVGDSMVAGFEVPYADTFVARLQGELTRRLGRPVRTINAGVRGYGTDQVLLYYRSRGRSLSPDVVVHWHSGNDLVDNTTLHEMRRPLGKPALALGPDGALTAVGQPVPRYAACSEHQLTAEAKAKRVDTPAGRFWCRAQLLVFDHSALFSYAALSIPWDYATLQRIYSLGNAHDARLKTARAAEFDAFPSRLALAILTELHREVTDDGAEFLMVAYPRHLERIDVDRLEQRGVAIRPLHEVEARDRREISWKHDSHLNPVGHQLVASLLAPEIASRLRD